jgi:hypothetical protein
MRQAACSDGWRHCRCESNSGHHTNFWRILNQTSLVVGAFCETAEYCRRSIRVEVRFLMISWGPPCSGLFQVDQTAHGTHLVQAVRSAADEFALPTALLLAVWKKPRPCLIASCCGSILRRHRANLALFLRCFLLPQSHLRFYPGSSQLLRLVFSKVANRPHLSLSSTRPLSSPSSRRTAACIIDCQFTLVDRARRPRFGIGLHPRFVGLFAPRLGRKQQPSRRIRNPTRQVFSGSRGESLERVKMHGVHQC